MTSTDFATERPDRADVLGLLADTIETTHEQIEHFEAETVEEQELLIKWIRAHGYLAGQYRKLLKDEDLDELEEEIDLVKMVAGLDDE